MHLLRRLRRDFLLWHPPLRLKQRVTWEPLYVSAHEEEMHMRQTEKGGGFDAHQKLTKRWALSKSLRDGDSRRDGAFKDADCFAVAEYNWKGREMEERGVGWGGVGLPWHVEQPLHQATVCENRVVSTQQLTLSPPVCHIHLHNPSMLLPNGSSLCIACTNQQLARVCESRAEGRW